MKPLTQKRQKAGSPQAASRCLSALLWKDIAQMRLLELGSTASLFDLFLDLFGFVFASAFLNRSRSAFNQLFGFFQTQASNFTYGLDHANFLVAERGQNHVEFVLFHGGIGTCAQGLAAGVPQLIASMAHDQFDNAGRLEDLGVGAQLTHAQYTGARAAEVLSELLASREIAESCLRARDRVEDGTPRVVAALERLATD